MRKSCNKVSLFAKEVDDGGNNGDKIFAYPIESRHKAIVGKRRLENVIERLLGGNVLLLFEDGAGDYFRIGEFWFPTFGVFPFVEFQFAEDLCYDSLE